jgi:hypothetical protein
VADADARRLFANMTVGPNGTRQKLVTQTIRALKASGVWSLIDALYMTAAHDSQAALLNWKNPGTWTLAATNSPTFTADRGYQGDGATSYLAASSYNPSTAGGNFALNSATLGVWIQQASSVAGSVDVAASTTSRIGLSGGATGYLARVNDGTSLTSSPASLAATHWAGRRLASGGKDLWRAGAQYNTADSVSSTSVGTSLLIGTNTTGAGFSNARVAAAYTAGGLSDVQMVAMHAALLAYMQGVGIA